METFITIDNRAARRLLAELRIEIDVDDPRSSIDIATQYLRTGSVAICANCEVNPVDESISTQTVRENLDLHT